MIGDMPNEDTHLVKAKAVPVPPHGRLKDVDALDYTMLYKENWMRGTGIEAPGVWKSDIDAAPTIIPTEESDMDTEEIVRCKDCEHWETSWTPRGVSNGRHYCAPLDLYPSADWFCADGKKRTETKQLSNVPVVIEAEEGENFADKTKSDKKYQK